MLNLLHAGVKPGETDRRIGVGTAFADPPTRSAGAPEFWILESAFCILNPDIFSPFACETGRVGI